MIFKDFSKFKRQLQIQLRNLWYLCGCHYEQAVRVSSVCEVMAEIFEVFLIEVYIYQMTTGLRVQVS